MNVDSAALDLLEILSHCRKKTSRPTLDSLTETFEAWENGNRLRPRFRALARSQLVDLHGEGRDVRVSLTPAGTLAASGGVDPEDRWRRSWDGQWRLLLFDLSAKQANLRMPLWRWMRNHRLGHLQNSVWITPDPLDDADLPLRQLRLPPDACTVIEGHPVSPDRDSDLVHTAWDFGVINLAYDGVIQMAAEGRELAASDATTPAERKQWLRGHREAWYRALAVDPLLPASLHPPGYLGGAALQARRAAFTALATSSVPSASKPE